MKKTILALFIAIGIIFTFQIHLSQARIIIDTLEDIGPDGTHVTSREIAGVTVTISTADQTPMKAYTYYRSPHAFAGKDQEGNAPLHPENVSGNRFISAQYINLRQPIVFTFSKPVIGFGFTTLDLLENGCHSTDFIKLEALNSNGQVVDSQTLTGPQGLSGLDIHWYLSSNIPEITQVVLSSNIVYGPHYGIDDLLIDVEPITHNIIDATYGAGVGSFEKGTIVLGGQPFSGTSWMGVAPGDNKTIKGWTVGGPGNGVDWLIAPYFRADSGKRSIDLQQTSSSSISTIIPTITGRLYELSFGAASVSGSNYNNNGIVSAGSLLNQPFYAEFSSDFSSQTYEPHTFYFTATDETTTVHFEAVGPGVYGPVIDSVSVKEVPDHFGTTLQTAPNYDFFVEQYAQTTESIYLYNPGNEERTATIDILNPHPELDVSLQNEEITVGPRATQTVPLIINADYTPIGIYEDLLIKISVDDGETLLSNLKVTILAPDAPPLPDLSIRSDDIRLADQNGETVTLSAVIHNKGLASASNVEVEFFDLFGYSLGFTTLGEISPNGAVTASITTTFATAGEHLVRVVIDPKNQIDEIDKNNNEASTVIQVGTGESLSGNILVTGSLPSNVYTGSLFTISGRAVYDIYQDGVRYTDYPVKGGSVQITIRNSGGAEWVYGGIYTNVDGYFRKRLQAPAETGEYEIFMTVTDNTFVGGRELQFSVTERDPYTPPPSPPNTTGSGEWSYINGTWTWTWIERPVNEPTPQSDVRVYSENIHFTKTNPEPYEEITVFAEILYWGTSTDLTANNVPVNFYVTYPGEDKINIGSTLISSISVGAPDFGSRYVYTTWKNYKGGIYIVEVEIDPSYKEENMLNNAATRAIIVGQLDVGAISGQVTDAWGGISDVTIKLFDSNGDFISDITDDTGLYFFSDLQAGEYQVHIVTPDGYEADADMKMASVSNQVTEVNFHLTGQSYLFADAGENVTITSEEQCETIIKGYGENASEYRWLKGETVLLYWTLIGVNNEAYLDLCYHFLDIGQHTLTLEVRDGNWLARDEMLLTIDNSPPDISAWGGGTYHITQLITVGGSVSDYDGDLLSYNWSKGDVEYCEGEILSIAGGEPVDLDLCELPELAVGEHTITLEVSDGVNDPVSANVNIEVISTPDPTLSPIASPGILWPPNHKMVDVVIFANASGACDITLSAYISSNEPIDGTGDGHFSPDWELLEIDQENQVIYLQLRAERSGRGKGRVYTVTVTATDCYGNSSSTDVKIVVPHDQRAK